MTGGWITLNALGGSGQPILCDFVFCKGWGFFALSFSYLPIFQALIILVRMISKKYIDTENTSCYSLPCLSNLIPADLLTLLPA